MTRQLVAAAVTIVAVALTGCSGDDGEDASGLASTPTPAETSTTAPASPAETPSGDETAAAASSVAEAVEGAREFAKVVRERVPEVARGRQDQEIAAVAVAACAGLAAGASADQLIAAARSLGSLDATAIDTATARELVKLAIETTCPDQADRVDEF